MKKQSKKTKRVLTLLVLIAIGCGVNEVFAQNILSYHPVAKALSLGKSFDLFNPSSAFAADIFSSYSTIKSGSTSQQVYLSVIDKKETYNQTMHIDASMDASFLSLFSASGSYSSSESQFYSTSSMSICIVGEADYGDFKITNPVLNPAVYNFVNNPEAFKQQFGEFYVSSVKKKQSLYVFITLNNITQTMKNQLSAELSAGGGFAVFSADLQGKVNKIVEQYRNSHSVQLRVLSFGRNDLKELPLGDITSDFFANGTFSTNTYNAIIKYMNNNFSESKSSEVEYSYSPLSQFGYRNDSYFDKIRRKYDKYINLCTEYKQYNDLYTEYKQAVSVSGYSLVTNADKTALNNFKRIIQNRIDDLSDAMANCRADSCSTMSTCCNINDIPTLIEQNKLDELRNRYLSPLNGLASFQTTGPTRFDFQPTYLTVFSKRNTDYSRLNITSNNQNKYTIEASLDFINGIPGRANYTVTIYINGFPMRSGPLVVEGNAIGHYYFVSDPIPVGQLFANRLPEDVSIRFDLNGYVPAPGGNGFYITMLPYSRLLFHF